MLDESPVLPPVHIEGVQVPALDQVLRQTVADLRVVDVVFARTKTWRCAETATAMALEEVVRFVSGAGEHGASRRSRIGVASRATVAVADDLATRVHKQ